ncbi:MAG TPA: 2-dehydropantoate 2-reductase N-terminal domain-containing protein, partial [Alphaproteobacteria bacterium]|nr:2-dehydropantoate 2-reductase N-terminal domain-containing protein [Alphaproteobacteria bacterium]
MTRISVIGAGAWGTALAQCYATAGHEVTLWCREPELAEQITECGENKKYLAGVKLHNAIDVKTDLSEIVTADIILNVTPAQYLRESLKQIAPLLRDNEIIVICAKGIEISSH